MRVIPRAIERLRLLHSGVKDSGCPLEADSYRDALDLGIEALEFVEARQRQEESWGIPHRNSNYRLPSESRLELKEER